MTFKMEATCPAIPPELKECPERLIRQSLREQLRWRS